jgi:hypothetical protein
MKLLLLLSILIASSEGDSTFPVDVLGHGFQTHKTITYQPTAAPRYQPLRDYAALLFGLKEKVKPIGSNWISVLVSVSPAKGETADGLTQLSALRQKLLNVFGSNGMVAFESHIEQCKDLETAEEVVVDFESDLEDLRTLLLLNQQKRYER